MKRSLLIIFVFQSFFVFSQTIDFHIKVDQFGYRETDTKVAVISKAITGYNAPDSYTPGSSFKVIREDGSTAYSGTAATWNSGQTQAQSGDKVWWFDFSSVTASGKYYVLDVTNNIRSAEFEIRNDVYRNVLKHACRMFFYQRCNIAKTTPYADSRWTDGASHRQDTACRSVTDQNNPASAKNLSGGWFDAGDFNKYVNFSHNPVHQLLDAYDETPDAFTDHFDIPESGNGIPDVLDELKWELDWLLKMQLSNGSVLSKVSTLNHLSASPASADNNPRYYGAASASATRSVASMFAHASLVFRKPNIPAMNVYADTLLARAIKAWNWITANPATSNYDNAGFASANPEQTAYFQNATRTCAAVYLFAATGTATYKTYFESNYTNLQPYQWGYWYPYESCYQSAMLYYTKLSGITASVKTNILNNCKGAINSGNGDLLTAYNNKTDAYKAQLADNDYVWGSSQVKSNMGTLFADMWVYGVDPTNDAKYKIAAEDYIHYMHGINAVGKSMLSNMYGEGGDNSINEIYHTWFGDGTIYDNAKTSPNGPPHGYVTGGINKSYSPDGAYTGPVISPPQNQPVQKCYKDWNTNWPENSWEISEPAIYYQAAYIKLLSKFASGSEAPCYYPNERNYKTVTDITTTSAKCHWRRQTAQTQFRYCEGNTFNWSTPVTTTDTFAIASGLKPNTTYSWVTRYICNVGDSSYWMDTLSFTTLAEPCTSPDSLLTTQIDEHSATLNWNSVTGAVKYIVKIRKDGGASQQYTVTSSPYTATGLDPNTFYIWTVWTICAGDTSDPTDSTYFKTENIPASPCISPDTLTTSQITDNSANLNWNSIPGALGYIVKIRKDGGPVLQYSVSSSPYTANGLDQNSYYIWTVSTICAPDTSSPTDSTYFKTDSLISSGPCESPDSIYLDYVMTNEASIYWSPVSNGTQYIVRYGRTPSGPFTEVTVSDTSYILTGLDQGKQYTVTVRSICDQDSSLKKAETHFYTAGCTVPDPITVVFNDTSAQLSWDDTHALGYFIYYKADGDSTYESTSTSNTNITLSPLEPGVHYTFYIQVNCNNGTVYSGAVHDFTTTNAPCGLITDTLRVSSVSDTSAIVNWNAVSGADGYVFIYRKDGSGINDTIIVHDTTVFISGLDPNSNYIITVYVICADGDVSETSTKTQFKTTNKVGLYESNGTTRLKIFPNPSSDRIWIQTTAHISHIQVFDLAGKLIDSLLPDAQNGLSLPAAKGFYLIRVLTTDGSQQTEKILKE